MTLWRTYLPKSDSKPLLASGGCMAPCHAHARMRDCPCVLALALGHQGVGCDRSTLPVSAGRDVTRRLPTVHRHHATPVPLCFVGQLAPELIKAHIGNGLRQMVVLQHACDMQVFD